MTEKWYLKSQEELESVLKTSAVGGLDPSAAASRLKADGGNNIFSLKRRTALRVAIRECFDLPAVLLLFILLLQGFSRENVLSVLVILAAVISRVFLYIRSMHVFADMAVRAIPRARVVRRGRLLRIDSRKVVQGDLLYLRPGDFIPADARIIKGHVRVSEHRITKKKAPAEKEDSTIARTGSLELSSLTNMVFAGSRVIEGTAMAIVTDIGADTLLLEFNGRIPISTYDRMPVVRRMARSCSVCEMLLLALVVIFAFFSVVLGEGVSIVRTFILSLATVVTAVNECYFAYCSHVVSRAILSLDGTRTEERTLIKDMRLLDLLSDADYVLIRDRFAKEEGSRLTAAVNRLKQLGIRPILLTDRIEYAEIFFGKLSCFAEGKERFLSRAKFLAATDARLWQLADKIGVYSCLDTAESLRLLRVLQMNGATVAVLSSDKQDADLLCEADISVTVLLPDKSREEGSATEAEMIADIHIPARRRAEGGIRAFADCLRLAKALPARLNALFGYFVTSVTARAVLCILGILVPSFGIGPYCILAGGLLGDLGMAAVLASTDSGPNGRVTDNRFRYFGIKSLLTPALAGLVSTGTVLLAYAAEHHFVGKAGGGYFLVLSLIASLFSGIAYIRREGVASTPIGWIPTVLYALLLIAVTAALILLPPLSTLLMTEGIGFAAGILAFATGILQIFCQKILFGTKILIQNY